MPRIKFAPRPTLALPIALLATACAGSPPIIANKAPCTELIPQAWRKPVEGSVPPAITSRADYPAGPAGDALYADQIARVWMQFGLAQTGQLEKANGRASDAIGIVERCEDRDRKAVDGARPKVLGIF
ncbi:hypothetical protein [Altererythrobacter sp. Root672]|uniref:hypothetical protein n=1 Tax=Altererythrobacter sp. Root672 TaxID=1736584 RepID=UPI00138F7911|nr:hypothetical protein [Altererythrobacter sp. Root672]